MRAKKYMRLKPAFVTTFPWWDTNLQEFRAWAHGMDRAPPRIAINVHKMYSMKLGRSVPDYVILAFTEWIGDVKGMKQYGLNTIAEECEPPGEQAGKPTLAPNPWRTNYLTLLGYLSRHFDVPDEGFCAYEQDVAKAAALVVECVGRAYDSSLAGQTAITLGKQHMKREVDDYAQLLRNLWTANDVSVMLTPSRERNANLARDQEGELIPAGVSVAAAVTKDFYNRFKSGQAEDSDITATDLLFQSKYLLIDALFDIDLITKKSRRPNYAVVNTILYQTAALTPPLHRNNVSIITFAGNPEAEILLQSYNYTLVGHTTRLTGKPIYELTTPRASVHGANFPLAYIQYNAFKLLLMLYQLRISGQENLLK